MTVAQPPKATLIIVDDDPDFLRSLELALTTRHFSVSGFTGADALIDRLSVKTADCVLLDLIMPGVSGLDLLKTVRKRRPDIPVIVMSGMGSIAIAVEAMSCGAADFIEKPFELDDLVTRLERRLIRNAQRRTSTTLQRTFGDFPGFQSLTGREHEVLAQIALGASSKEAGRTLGISRRTVDVHRARIKEKLQVRRAVDLVRLVYAGAGKS